MLYYEYEKPLSDFVETDEYRPPQNGEWFASEGQPGKALMCGKRFSPDGSRAILVPKDSPDITTRLGAFESDNKGYQHPPVPEGWELTGEYRELRKGDYWIHPDERVSMVVGAMGPAKNVKVGADLIRWIVRKKPNYKQPIWVDVDDSPLVFVQPDSEGQAREVLLSIMRDENETSTTRIYAARSLLGL